MFNFFFSSPFGNNTGKSMAKGLLITGLFLIGFSMLVWILREIFAFIAAGIFMLAGLFCCINAVKIYLTFKKNSSSPNQDSQYRKNVTIRYNEE